MVFNRSGRVIKSERYYYLNQELEVVPSFQYLGILFTPSGSFSRAVEDLTAKGKIALGSVWSILINSRMQSWNSRWKIFDAISLAVLMYGVAVWGPWHVDEVNRFQNSFLKSLLRLPKCTPGYLLRLETGTDNAEIRIWKISLRWWIRILQMSSDRYPRICFNEMKRMDKRSAEGLTPDRSNNWATNIRMYLELLGYSDLWNADPSCVADKLQDIHSLYSDISYYTDRNSAQASSYSPLYNKFAPCYYGSPYLFMNVALEKARVIAQLRLNGIYFFRLLSRGEKHVFHVNSNCTICNLQRSDDMFHLIAECSVYKDLRIDLTRNLSAPITPVNFHSLLEMRSPADIFRVYNFTRQALNVRSWTLNE